MQPSQRRQMIRNAVSEALSRSNPLFRYLALAWPRPGDETDRDPVSVLVGGQEPGVIRLAVRVVNPDEEVARALTEYGFAGDADLDDPRYTIYAATAPDPTADELATFVEWAFRRVARAPEDYEPGLELPRAEKRAKKAGEPRRGCFRSCTTAIIWLFVAIVAIVLLFLFQQGSR